MSVVVFGIAFVSVMIPQLYDRQLDVAEAEMALKEVHGLSVQVAVILRHLQMPLRAVVSLF